MNGLIVPAMYKTKDKNWKQARFGCNRVIKVIKVETSSSK